MGTYVPVYGTEDELTADCVRYAVAQQDPSLRSGDLGVWHGTDYMFSELPLSRQGVRHRDTVFVREIGERDVW